MSDYKDQYIAKLPDFESDVPWIYLDTHVPPLVTVGIGCAIGIAEALTLPFVLDGTTPPMAASEGVIALNFHKVTAMAPGRVAGYYKYPGCLILPQPAINALVLKRLTAFEAALVVIFPDFLTWPDGPKIGAMDLMYGMGAHGFLTFTKFVASCKEHNWQIAASQCAENQANLAYDTRNNWRRQQMLKGLAA